MTLKAAASTSTSPSGRRGTDRDGRTASTAKISDSRMLDASSRKDQRSVGVAKPDSPAVRTIEQTVMRMLALVSAIDDSWLCPCWIVSSA